MKKIKWYQETMRYSIFFGILTLISFAGGYIHGKFYSQLFSKIGYSMAIVFGILTLYWACKKEE
ncbi:hypothetical protein BMS3Abin17_01330 [archaeon BMS3Abin17]|nr:hypothetical protein BMS3Abin17_01330 [archaeon BMS3Abin17]HDZ60935.1 hypothetical protein [Candidatus Pacearchaeota archaeon]